MSNRMSRVRYLSVESRDAPRGCRPWREAFGPESSPCPWRTCRGLACESAAAPHLPARILWWPSWASARRHSPTTIEDLSLRFKRFGTTNKNRIKKKNSEICHVSPTGFTQPRESRERDTDNTHTRAHSTCNTKIFFFLNKNKTKDDWRWWCMWLLKKKKKDVVLLLDPHRRLN